MHYVIVSAPQEKWTWELRSSGGQAVCRSTGSYGSHESVLAAVDEIRKSVLNADIACADGFQLGALRASS